HARRLKRKPWEESIRVPGILRYPAEVRPMGTIETLFSHVDVAPTLLRLCGLPIPPSMQGSDLSPVILGASERGPESVFFQIFVPYAGDETPLPWRGVRTSSHLYARTEGAPWLLYDLAKDPFEQKNLADDPAAVELRRRMEALLTDWMTRTGD